MKIKTKSILSNYIIYFFILDLLFYFVLHGEYATLFHLFSEAFIVMLLIRCYKPSHRKLLFVFLVWTFCTIGCVIHIFRLEFALLSNYIYFIAIALLGNTIKFKEDLLSFIVKNRVKVTFASIMYACIIIYTVINGMGIQKGWNTTTVVGPYRSPHMLAYGLMVVLGLNLLYVISKPKIINIVLSLSTIVGIFLTASRSAMLGLLVILCFFVTRFNVNKKLLIAVMVTLVGIYIYQYTDILDAVLLKTELAVSNGSISNGRLEIFDSSIRTFANYQGYEKWLFGIGYDNLYVGNKITLGLSIQAHNDILNALICSGVFLGVVFVYSIFMLISKGKGKIYQLLFLMVLINTNGLVAYTALSIPVIIMMIYFESPKNARKVI